MAIVQPNTPVQLNTPVQPNTPESYITGIRVSNVDEFFDNTVDFNNISYIIATITLKNGQTSTYTLRKSLSSDSFACFGAPADSGLTKFRFDSLNPVSIVYDNGRYSLYIPDPNAVGYTFDFDIKARAVEDNNHTTAYFSDLVNSVTEDCVEKVSVVGRFSWYDIPATKAGYVSARAIGATKIPSGYNGALIASDYDPSNGRVIAVCTENPLTHNFDYFYCPVEDVLYIYEDFINGYGVTPTPYISKVILRGSLSNNIMTDLVYTFINNTSETSEGDTIDLIDVPICAIVKTKNLVRVKYSDIVEEGGSA